MNGSSIPAMFATRLLDGAQVVIKRVRRLDSGLDEELKTMLLVSSEGLRDDPMNHCIQLLEWFPVEDDVEPELSVDQLAFAVMPLLRDWRQPSFRLAAESLEFISQLLEVWFRDLHIRLQGSYKFDRASLSCIKTTLPIG